MIGVGPSVDPVTGLPEEAMWLDQKKRQRKSLERAISRRDELLRDLSGEGGAVLTAFMSRLINRINHLIDHDPEANAIKSVMAGLTHEINYGQKVANDLARDLST